MGSMGANPSGNDGALLPPLFYDRELLDSNFRVTHIPEPSDGRDSCSHFISAIGHRDLLRALGGWGDGDEVFDEALAVGVEEVVDSIEAGGADD